MRHMLEIGLVAGGIVLAAAAAHAQNGTDVPSIAIVDGVPITAADLNREVGNKLNQIRAQEFALKRTVLERMIAQRLLEREATRRGISVSALEAAEVDGKIAPVSDVEVRAVYEASKDQLPPGETEALAQIRSSLTTARQSKRRAEFLNDLRTRADVRVLMEPPRVSVDISHSPSRGRADAPVTIVEFSDFECPFCRRTQPTLKALQTRYGDQVRVVFRHFPLNIHPAAP